MSAKDPSIAAAGYWRIRARIVRIVYLACLCLAMAGWAWLLFTGIEWLAG